MSDTTSRTAARLRIVLDGIAAVSLMLAGLCLTALVLLFGAVLVLRVFGVAVPSSDDLAGILLGGTLALGFAAAVARDQHVSVEYFIDRHAGAAAWIFRVVAALVMIGIVGFLLAGIFRLWHQAFLSGIMMLGSLPIPRSVPMGVVLLGVAMFELALVLRFFERLFGTGFGTPTSEELETGVLS